MSARRASAFLAAAAFCCLRGSGAAGDARAVERAGRGRVDLREHDATARGGPTLPAEPGSTRWSNSSLLEADRRLAEFAQDMPRRLQTVIGALRVLTGDAPGALKPPQDDALVRSLEKRAAVTPRLQPTLLQSEAEAAGVRERSRADDAARFGAALEKGLAAVDKAVKHFVAKPPEVGVGVDTLGKGLLDAIKAYVKEFNDPASFKIFETKWMRVCDKVAAKLPIFLKHIHKFQETGTYDYVITAVSDILDVLSEDIAKFAPHGIAMKVVNYINAVEKMLDVIGDCWTPGKEAEAASVFYHGTRDVLNMVLQDDVKNNPVYETIVGTLNNVMGNLAETVAEFRKQIITSKVCRKHQVKRPNYAPKECPAGYWPDGERYCLPKVRLLETKASLLETSVAWKSWKFWDSKPEGALPATCKGGGEKINHRCYSACPATMEPMESASRKKCATKCAFEFGHDGDGELCGHNQDALREATAMMLLQGGGGFVVTMGHVYDMWNTGAATTESLTGTINGFTMMAKPFVLPSCPK